MKYISTCFFNLTLVGAPSLRHYIEDDARNAADSAGGHYFDSLHKQAHAIYDIAWERRAMARLDAAGRVCLVRALPPGESPPLPGS